MALTGKPVFYSLFSSFNERAKNVRYDELYFYLETIIRYTKCVSLSDVSRFIALHKPSFTLS